MNVIHHKHFPIKIYESTLANGMKVVMVPRPEFQTIETILQVKFGVKDEVDALETSLGYKPLPQGTAHFLEHRIFESKGEQLSRYFAEHGATINASTGTTTTQYYFSTIRDFPELLKTFLNFIQRYEDSEEGVQKEAGIVFREFVRRYESQEAKITQYMMKTVFPEHHLSREILGIESTIHAINKDHLALAHTQYYRPSNLTLTIVGNFDERDILSLINSIESTIEDRRPLPNKPYQENVSIIGKMRYHEQAFDVTIEEDHFYLKLQPQVKTDGFEVNQRKSLLFKFICKMLFNANTPLYLSWQKLGLLESSLTGGVYGLVDSYWVVIYEAHTKKPTALFEGLKTIFTLEWDDTVMIPIFEDIQKLLLGVSYKQINSLSGIANSLVENAAQDQPYLSSLSVIPTITYEEVKQFYQSIQIFDLDYFHIIPNLKR
jgi:hypothetical protein